MAVRSAYSNTSYRAHRPGVPRNRVEQDIAEPEARDCNQCKYKRQVEQMMQTLGGNQVQCQPDYQNYGPRPTPAPLETPMEKPKKGLLGRFGAYVAKNQKANRDAGETSLFDDLGKYANNITDGCAKLGEEESAAISKRNSASRRTDHSNEDDDKINFLMGKRKK
jgi:hypothetical protein